MWLDLFGVVMILFSAKEEVKELGNTRFVLLGQSILVQLLKMCFWDMLNVASDIVILSFINFTFSILSSYNFDSTNLIYSNCLFFLFFLVFIFLLGTFFLFINSRFRFLEKGLLRLSATGIRSAKVQLSYGCKYESR